MHPPIPDARPWYVATFVLACLWVVSALVFSDLCLSFGGGGNSCKSRFDYPEIVAFFAMLGTVYGIPLTLLAGLGAAVQSIRRARWRRKHASLAA